ncbi:MAG: ribose transport system substrate-binding protein [Gaiellales bacterium]|nr:ribose transport system substrate-binding protein [Gaiellales bacterium]
MNGRSVRGHRARLGSRGGRATLVATCLVAASAVAAVGASASPARHAAAWPNVAQETAKVGVFPGIKFCGSKPIKLGIHDGFGINAWSQASMAAVRSEAAKCSNVTQIVAIGGGDLQKSISDVNSMVAQGANAIVMIPDFGQAQLASIKAATAAGVKVVPWAADPGGTAGSDYVSYVDWSSPAAGTMWANWMVKVLKGKGNVVFLGGPAGNPVTSGQLKSVVAVFAKHPGMKLLTGKSNWPVTNWDPATAQKQMSALLAKYSKIDGIISDYGTDALAATRAIQAANRKLPPIATLDANGLSCLYKKVHASNPGFQLATISSRNWLGRIAARKAIAAAEGLPNQEPSQFALPFFEDTTSAGKPAQCLASASPDFYASNKLTTATVSKYGKP